SRRVPALLQVFVALRRSRSTAVRGSMPLPPPSVCGVHLPVRILRVRGKPVIYRVHIFPFVPAELSAPFAYQLRRLLVAGAVHALGLYLRGQRRTFVAAQQYLTAVHACAAEIAHYRLRAV